MPPEVAARLDEVLAGLRADTGAPAPAAGDEPERAATVVPLRRRAARLSRYVLAAAAVLAIGYGSVEVVGGSLGSGGESDSAGSSSQADDGAGSGADSGAAAEDAPPPTALAELGVKGLVPLSPSTLDQDLYALDSDTEKGAPSLRGARRLSESCGPRTPVPGSRTLAAAYAGRPTLVVYLPPDGGSQRVDLYLCDAEQPRQAFRSVTLPAGE